MVAEIGKGHHTGTTSTVDDLFHEWILELERKGRSPYTVHNYDKTYQHNIAATLGSVAVSKVTTKMLTDLYSEHQRRGLKLRSVYQIHATMSSMMTQACRWGWRRPEYARAIFVAATTGLRRGELCALRVKRDIDWDRGVATIAWNLIDLNGRESFQAPTKNRRIRQIALDNRTLGVLRTQLDMMEQRAAQAGTELLADGFLFSDSADGGEPWQPGAVTLYFDHPRGPRNPVHIQRLYRLLSSTSDAPFRRSYWSMLG